MVVVVLQQPQPMMRERGSCANNNDDDDANNSINNRKHETKVLALLKQVTCTACHLCIEQGTWLVHAGPAQAAAVQLPRIEDQAGFLTWEK